MNSVSHLPETASACSTENKPGIAPTPCASALVTAAPETPTYGPELYPLDAPPPADIQQYPAAACIPSMRHDEYERLLADIKIHGLRDRITLVRSGAQWLVLDGMNRLRACIEAGVPPLFAEYRGQNPEAFFLSRNLRRRQLSLDQRAASAALYAQEQAPAALARRGHGKTAPGKALVEKGSGALSAGRTRTIAGQLFGVNERYVQNARMLLARDKDLFGAVHRGEKTLQEATKELKASSFEANDASKPADKVTKVIKLLEKHATGLRSVVKGFPAEGFTDEQRATIITVAADVTDLISKLRTRCGLAGASGPPTASAPGAANPVDKGINSGNKRSRSRQQPHGKAKNTHAAGRRGGVARGIEKPMGCAKCSSIWVPSRPVR